MCALRESCGHSVSLQLFSANYIQLSFQCSYVHGVVVSISISISVNTEVFWYIGSENCCTANTEVPRSILTVWNFFTAPNLMICLWQIFNVISYIIEQCIAKYFQRKLDFPVNFKHLQCCLKLIRWHVIWWCI